MIDPNEKDFLDFVNSKKVSPPNHLSIEVLSLIKADLDPSHKIVFTKLILIQAFIGFITLSFCPQFSLSLTNNHEMFHYFHHTFGEQICMIICGTVFMGSGAIFAAYLLKKEEIKKIKETKFLYYFSISIIFISIFFLLGAQSYLSLIFFWFIGSSLGGLVLFELNRIIRKEVLHY